MDIEGLERLLLGIESGTVRVIARDLTQPSPLALEVLSARPYNAEQYRAGRSLQNIRTNLDALKAAVLGPDGFATLIPPKLSVDFIQGIESVFQ